MRKQHPGSVTDVSATGVAVSARASGVRGNGRRKPREGVAAGQGVVFSPEYRDGIQKALKAGRPPVKVYDEVELAELLGLPVHLVLRQLLAPGRSFFLRSRFNSPAQRWEIPQKDVQQYMGMRAERLYSLQHVAELWDISYNWLWENVRAGNVASVKVLERVRIPESVVMAPPRLQRVSVRPNELTEAAEED